jgi:hypothetical protein
MSIVAASKQETILGAALAYLEIGISVLPVIGKKVPLKSWVEFQTKRAPFSYVHNWHKAGLLRGVGILGGVVSGGLCLMDLDGIEAVAKFEFTFPELLDTFTVLSGSGKGRHYYFYADDIPATTRTSGYELRVDGCYVVAPPSIHPETFKPYTVINPVEIKRVANLRAVVDFIRGLIEEKKKAQSKSTTNQPSIGFVRNSTAYGLGALDKAYHNVLAAPLNNRNNTLYRESLKLGSLVADGHISVGEVERDLMIACLHNGLTQEDGERQCMRTIKSGLDTGQLTSRRGWKELQRKLSR